jgi:hypothetical protein
MKASSPRASLASPNSNFGARAVEQEVSPFESIAARAFSIQQQIIASPVNYSVPSGSWYSQMLGLRIHQYDALRLHILELLRLLLLQ